MNQLTPTPPHSDWPDEFPPGEHVVIRHEMSGVELEGTVEGVHGVDYYHWDLPENATAFVLDLGVTRESDGDKGVIGCVVAIDPGYDDEGNPLMALPQHVAQFVWKRVKRDTSTEDAAEAFLAHLRTLEDYENGNMPRDEEEARRQSFLAGWTAHGAQTTEAAPAYRMPGADAIEAGLESLTIRPGAGQ